MANQLKMAGIAAILALKARGWSDRKIAEHLQVDRGTVARYVKLALALAKPANALSGKTLEISAVGDAEPVQGLIGPLGVGGDANLARHWDYDSKPAIVLAGKTLEISPDDAETSGVGTELAADRSDIDGLAAADRPVAAAEPGDSKPAIVLSGKMLGISSGIDAIAVGGRNDELAAQSDLTVDRESLGEGLVADGRPKPAIVLAGKTLEKSIAVAPTEHNQSNASMHNQSDADRLVAGPPTIAKPTAANPDLAKWSQLAELVRKDEALRRLAARNDRGRGSLCEPFREPIQQMVDERLTAQRIWQDLRERGFSGSVYSVQRFVRRLIAAAPEPFRRMECGPGEEAQIDFGTGAPIVQGDKRRRPHVFRIVLSRSRKAYSEVVYRQTTENFLRCIENAFWHFGGVPRTLVIDNLKAAVTRGDWYDPETNPKLQSFCAHYGTVILPTKPRTPRHKGKVERGVGYVKENALRGRVFDSIEKQNEHLLQWESQVADRRIHGTTRRHVGEHFETVERPALLPLPTERFAFFHEAKRMVHRDGHVEVAKAYYSAPPEYVGRPVWARWDGRVVRIFNTKMEQIAMHVRHEPGKFRTDRGHLSDRKISLVESDTAELLDRARIIGEKTVGWAAAMIAARGIEGVRVLIGLLSLARKHPAAALESACDIALSHGAFRLRSVRALIGKQAAKQPPLEFLDEHPIIRPLTDYGEVVRQAFEQQRNRCDAP